MHCGCVVARSRRNLFELRLGVQVAAALGQDAGQLHARALIVRDLRQAFFTAVDHLAILESHENRSFREHFEEVFHQPRNPGRSHYVERRQAAQSGLGE